MAVNGVMVLPLADSAGGSLLKRIGSALILAPTVLFLVYAGPPYFSVLVLLAALTMTMEWVRLCAAKMALIPMLGVGFSVIAAVGLAGLGQFGWAVAATFAGAVAVWVLVAVLDSKRLAPWMAGGVVYIALPCVAMIWLRGEAETGRDVVFWLLAVVWGMDIGAFAVGKTVGGPKLAPAISPKKTWSGLLGGAVCSALAAATVLALLNGGSRSSVAMAVGAAGLGILSQCGDLFESAVKRHFNAKDSGSLIPGHGGLLDRVDGLLAAAVILAAYNLASGEGIAL